MKNIHPGEICVAICVTACIAVPGALLGYEGTGLGLGLLLGLVGAALRHAYVQQLKTRATQPDALQWDVRVNGVVVGTISDARYADMQLAVLGNPRLYFAQLVNLLGVGRQLLQSIVTGVPAVAFWGAALIALVWPETFIQFAVDLKSAPPEELIKAPVLVAKIALLAGGCVILINAILLGARYGLVNCFAKGAADLLRKELQTAAQGEVVLVSHSDGRAHCICSHA